MLLKLTRDGFIKRSKSETGIKMNPLILLPLIFILGSSSPEVTKDCTCNKLKLYGKIKFVNDFPDLKIKIVENFPDLKVQIVENFPDKRGKWQIVEDFPDIKVKIVNDFPDLKIKFVENFPGLP